MVGEFTVIEIYIPMLLLDWVSKQCMNAELYQQIYYSHSFENNRKKNAVRQAKPYVFYMKKPPVMKKHLFFKGSGLSLKNQAYQHNINIVAN